MSLYLCVDCGGSKTSAVISDASGKIVGRAYGGPSNVAYLTVASFIEVIRGTVGEALKTCSEPASVELVPLPPPENLRFAAAWFGISGADSPSIIESVVTPLTSLLGIPKGPRLSVANDAHLLAAPIRMHADVSSAVTVIGGTGSIVVSFKEREDGELQELGRVGGWGWILGDEGGGYSVGREAVRQVLAEQDRHSVMANPPPEGALRGLLKKYFNIKDVMELLTEVYIPDPSPSAVAPDRGAHAYMAREKRLSSLSPLVFTAAFEAHDPLALNVLRTCARDLADQICIVVGDATEETPGLVDASESVICFGGSLVGLDVYRKLVLDELASKGHVFKHVEFVDDCAKVGAAGLRLKYTN
ncbi:hypothetical protein BDP27DRAFT_1315309 [Rhodocollybia butyracea]|uniref:N-acetyl-D-glucosamine kinase n=1 Tax=Rhodocollybia butyracea TaxID=206335 RepID=A0A9P5Q5R4_9AGAR|nr:hypothetical protein BDP27DRAFT_1315309 [Rhodocollybia butyracea]